MHELKFRKRHQYDNRQDGITVPVLLRTVGMSIDLLAKIDTGAEDCLFERAYAEALEIRVEDGIRRAFRTANSRFEAFGHELTLEVLGMEFSSMIYFFADTGITKNVLGRRGYLDRVRFGLIEHDSILFCSTYDDGEDRGFGLRLSRRKGS